MGGRVRPERVRVNAVNPGPTRTEGTAMVGEATDQSAALAPAGRPASPDEIAAAITYLASDDASFVHGAILAVEAAAQRPDQYRDRCQRPNTVRRGDR